LNTIVQNSTESFVYVRLRLLIKFYRDERDSFLHGEGALSRKTS